jgi:hypothetical protein
LGVGVQSEPPLWHGESTWFPTAVDDSNL